MHDGDVVDIRFNVPADEVGQRLDDCAAGADQTLCDWAA
jgi:hypothetical protein